MQEAGTKLNAPVSVSQGGNPKCIEAVIDGSVCMAAIITQCQMDLVFAAMNHVETDHGGMMPAFLPQRGLTTFRSRNERLSVFQT